jgi:hypothetical protein
VRFRHAAAAAILALTAFPTSRLTAQDIMPPNMLSSDELTQGFRLLFDGSSTNGWRGFRRATMHDGWRAVDGALARVGPGGDIVTVDEYENFELRLQWKVPEGGNSGIMYHVSEDFAQTYLSGPEMQVLDDARHPDGRSRLTAAGSCHSVYPAPDGVVRPANQWNDVGIVVNGTHVEHWLNGVKVVEYELWSDDWRRRVQSSKFAQWPSYGMTHRGRIALQDHDGGVLYRSIRIRVLP